VEDITGTGSYPVAVFDVTDIKAWGSPTGCVVIVTYIDHPVL
jgi:hypothetical protein